MAKVEYGVISVLSTGGNTPVLNDSSLVVERVLLFVPTSSTETSVGYHDASVKFTGSSAYSEENTSKALTHYRNIGGTKTKVFECTVSNLDTGEFSISVTTCTSTTSLHFVAFGS